MVVGVSVSVPECPTKPNLNRAQVSLKSVDKCTHNVTQHSLIPVLKEMYL